MLFIKCPYCKEKREEEEFNYMDEAFIVRPENPKELSDEEWAEYLFMRANKKGDCYEQWVHTAGCRKFFVLKRSTINLEMEETLTMEEAAAKRSE